MTKCRDENRKASISVSCVHTLALSRSPRRPRSASPIHPRSSKVPPLSVVPVTLNSDVNDARRKGVGGVGTLWRDYTVQRGAFPTPLLLSLFSRRVNKVISEVRPITRLVRCQQWRKRLFLPRLAPGKQQLSCLHKVDTPRAQMPRRSVYTQTPR